MMQLLEPLSTPSFNLRNRVVLAPMTRGRSGPDRIPSDLNAIYYAQRAGAGLLITEATSISEEANGWVESPGIYTDKMVEGWKKVTEAVHDRGSQIYLQLWHTGRASHPSFLPGNALPVAPSAIPIDGDGVHTADGKKPHETPRALETDELPRVVDDYQKAAANAKAAGFDGVEVHSANGYLLDEFLQSRTNHREDDYGSSIENRFRLLDEVVGAVSAVWGPEHVGVRLSPNGAFNDMGSPDYREQFHYAASQLDKRGLAYLHVMDGLGFGFHELGDPVTLAETRQHFSGTLIGNVGYDADTANQAIENGDADLIAIGRPYISNPDWVERVAAGAEMNGDAPMEDWYTPKGAAGYTDYEPMGAG
ncbi:MAG: alkene reductase [Verrucomicrobiota bacterium]